MKTKESLHRCWRIHLNPRTKNGEWTSEAQDEKQKKSKATKMKKALILA